VKYRPLGRTGVMVSPLCLGTMNLGGPTDARESMRIIHRALEAGINLIDTANVYPGPIRGESERLIGRALQESGDRDRVVLATKVSAYMGQGPNDGGASRYHIIEACEASLRRLQTDHIDLYQLHRPSLTVPQDETLRALDDLVHAGKVRYIGCSTYPAWMVMEALAISERYGLARYVSEQPPYNLLDRRAENELIPLCQRYGLAVIPWAPLAHGVLTGKHSPDEKIAAESRAARAAAVFTHRALAVGAKVARMAEERGMSGAQLALLWVKEQPGVTAPIIGPRTVNYPTASGGACP
jgi:aryl-alcohol dehydrogenase-like predicted oxidoreductase